MAANNDVPVDRPGETTKLSMFPIERRAVGVIGLVLALRMFGLFVLLPVLALYAADLPGGTPFIAGLTVGAFGITQALLQVPAGLLSDRVGRKTVIVLGLVVFAFGSIVAAESESIAGVLTGRILQGAGAISAAATALVADLTRSVIRTRAMAFIGISIGGTFMLALALGPALAGLFGVPGLFYLGAALAVVATVVIVTGPGDWQPPPGSREFRLRECLADRQLAPLHIGIFLLHLLLTATFVAAPFLLRDELGVDVGAHSRVYLLAMALSLVATVPLIVAAERLAKPIIVFLVGIVLIALGQLGMVFATSSLYVMFALALFFGGFNFLEARLPARVSQAAGAEMRGTALGVFATGQFLGAFIGGLIGGALMRGSETDAVFGAGAALGVIWFVVVGAIVAIVGLSAKSD